MKAFAKINLGLNILNKRDDGYHNIETLFCKIGIYDEIEFSDSSDIKIESNFDWLPADESNICHKAAKLLQNECKIETGIKIKITKNIPVGAGLGGGSSDGALVLKYLNKKWNLNLSEEKLAELALKVGSDVPFFLKEGLAYATGRGEELNYISGHLPYFVVVVYPNLSVSTKWAYEQYVEKINPQKINYDKLFPEALNDRSLFRANFRNDFEEIVFKRYPGLISIKNVFYEKNAFYASLSGSGSALFGLFTDEMDAKRAYNAFISRFKTFICQPDFLKNESEL